MKGVTKMSLVAAAHAPLPYREPLSQRLLPITQYRPRFQSGASILIDTSPDQAWRVLKPLLSPLVAGTLGGFGTLARMEYLWDPEHDARGLLLFDSREHLIAHVVPARLTGLRSPGVELSRSITAAAGIPRLLFGEVMEAAHAIGACSWHQMVLSRQQHSFINGVDLAPPTTMVNSEWDWWSVQQSTAA